MLSIVNSGTRVQSNSEAHISGFARRRRQFLLATVFTTGLFATLGLSTDQAKAINECGNVGAGAFAIACGQGPYTSIVYGNAQTAPATSTVFTFTSTQATGGGFGDRQAVFLSSNELNHSITVSIQQPTIVPSFVGTSTGIFEGTPTDAFVVQTSGGTSAIVFNVANGIFTAGSGGGGGDSTSANGARVSTSGADSGITGTYGGTFTGGTSFLLGGSANGLVMVTGNNNSAINTTTTHGTYTGGTSGTGTAAAGLLLGTQGNNSGITHVITTGTFTGGTAGTGNASGIGIGTGGSTSAINLTMNGGSATGGTALLGGNAHGLGMTTSGADSGVTAALTGSFTGGNALLGNAFGVGISTTGTNSDVIFSLNGNGSTINGGTSPLSSADGVRIVTSQADSDITFNSAAGTTITGANGNGVTLHATGGASILAGDTINGTVNGGLTLLGVGLGAGFVGTSVGAGITDIHVGTTGIVNGTGAGLIGTAVDGNVTLLNEGQVNQTALVASSLNPFDPGYSIPFLALPVGMGGAATGTGSVIITTAVGSSVTQAGTQALTGIEGVGIVATTILGSGNASIADAGNTTATGIGLWANANSGTAVATSNGAVNVTGGSGGPTLFIDPYIIQSLSTVGILAQSVTNSATANLVALNGNPASVGGTNAPDIGVAANVFAGAANATVNVDGTNGGATVNANNTGLYAAVSILGTGNAIINQTNGTTTATVAAAAVALNPASSATINNDLNSVLNGAVVAAAGLDATVNNTNNSQINIPALSAQVVVAGRDATVNNLTGSSITLAGPLSFNLMVAGLAGNGGNAVINNANGGTSFTINGPLSANVMIAATDAVIDNSRGAQFNLNGPLTANLMFAGQDAIIRNHRGADFTIAGVADANVMVAGRDAIIENFNGGTFNMLGALNANLMFAGQDAKITNFNGGEFNILGAVNTNVMVAARDASIENFNGGDFTIAGIASGNLMFAGQDATISNHDGGDFTVAGALNGNLMFANRNATITNFNGGDFAILGVLSGNVMVAGQDATISNDTGGSFSLIGGGNGNLMVAGRDARIDNSRGADFNLLGINGSLAVAQQDATFNNSLGGDVNLLGGNVVAMVAGRDAAFNNSTFGTVNMVGLNAIVIDGVNSSTFNNSSNDGGNNRTDCTLNNLGGVCVNGVGVISGGLIGAPLEFNNSGGLVSMINQSSTVVTDAAAFFGITGLAYPQYNTAVGDVTVIGGNFNGGLNKSDGSQLGVDAFLKGPNNSSSDLMIVTQATSGKTGIIVNDLNPGPGQLNLRGIPVVAVVSGNTSKSDFFIDPSSSHYDPKFGGVIDKGLFIYSHQVKADPFFNTANGFANNGIDHVLVGTPDNELFEYSKASEGARNIWFESTGVWLERTADLRNLLMARGGGMPAGAGADLPVYKAPPAPPPVRGITPGVWMKGLASWTDRDSTDSFSILGSTFTFDTSYKQKVFGVIGGIDGGWDYRDSVFMVGLLGGYLDSNLKFNASSNSIDYSGGTVGAYATYLNRNFYIDTIFKADLLKMKWNANTLLGVGGSVPETNADSYGIQVDTGYRFNNGAWFWEPLGSFAWVRTNIDSIEVLGQNLAFGDTDSVRGSLGGRIGAANYWGGWKVEGSITGRVWHEWEDPAPLAVSQGLLTIQDQFKGTYGDVNGTLNFLSVATGWSSFLNGGIKWNSDFQTVSAKGGFRYNW